MPARNDAEAIFGQLFLTPEGRSNPYPLYHQLREAAPVRRVRTVGVDAVVGERG